MNNLILAVLTSLLDTNQDHKPIDQKIHFFGYGEVHFNSPKSDVIINRQPDEADVHRLVLGFSFDLAKEIRFVSEIDFEHAAKEIELEYAYIEFDLDKNTKLRAGSILMPMGMLNEFHEPPLFYSVERPYVESAIIPTTWQEIGFGLSGKLFEDKVKYRSYIVAGLDASKFADKNGIRGGRSKGGQGKSEDKAFITRIEYLPMLGLSLGGSFYIGGADHDDPTLDRVNVKMTEIDVRAEFKGFDIRTSFIRTDISNADQVSTKTSKTIGETLQGFYVETGYHILNSLAPQSDLDLVIFARFEAIDTHKEVPSGFTRNKTMDRTVKTIGLAYYPIQKLAIKADYEMWKDKTDREMGRFNLGIAFIY